MSIKDIDRAGQIGGLEYCVERLREVLAELEQAHKAYRLDIPTALGFAVVSAESIMKITADQIESVILAND